MREDGGHAVKGGLLRRLANLGRTVTSEGRLFVNVWLPFQWCRHSVLTLQFLCPLTQERRIPQLLVDSLPQTARHLVRSTWRTFGRNVVYIPTGTTCIQASNPQCPAITPHTKLATMAMPTNPVKDLLDSRIHELDGYTHETLQEKQVFGATSDIISLVRVRIVTLCSSKLCISLVYRKDKMIDDKEFVKLSEYFFRICTQLKAEIRGSNTGDLSQSVVTGLYDLERYVEWSGS